MNAKELFFPGSGIRPFCTSLTCKTRLIGLGFNVLLIILRYTLVEKIIYKDTIQMLHYHRRFRYNYHTSNGLTIMLLGILLGSPLLALLGYVQFVTAPVVYYTIAATSTASTAAFGLATLGMSALILYGSIGLAYLYSGANECYNTNKNPLDLLKSRIVNKDSLSFNSIINSIAALLWAPFLVLGGLSGMAIKAAVNGFSRTSSTKGTLALTESQIIERIQQLNQSLEPQKSYNFSVSWNVALTSDKLSVRSPAMMGSTVSQPQMSNYFNFFKPDQPIQSALRINKPPFTNLTSSLELSEESSSPQITST